MAAMKTTEKRLCILGEDEIEALYGRPRFTHDERIQYFSLSPTEKAALEALHPLAEYLFQLRKIQRLPKLLRSLLHLGFQLTDKIL
jgi:hypothetical protein